MSSTPLSRAEDILQATVDGTSYDEPPQSRVENLLLDLKEIIEQGGGGGGTVVVDKEISETSKNPVQNKVIAEALSKKQDITEGKGLSTEDYTTEDKEKLENISDMDDSDVDDVKNSFSLD